MGTEPASGKTAQTMESQSGMEPGRNLDSQEEALAMEANPGIRVRDRLRDAVLSAGDNQPFNFSPKQIKIKLSYLSSFYDPKKFGFNEPDAPTTTGSASMIIESISAGFP